MVWLLLSIIGVFLKLFTNPPSVFKKKKEVSVVVIVGCSLAPGPALCLAEGVLVVTRGHSNGLLILFFHSCPTVCF